MAARYEQELREANQVLGKQAEWLQSALASIGDAVVGADVEGRVVFLNTVAESMTGWRQAEAVGRPLGEVFRALDPLSREPIEAPVLSALGEKTAEAPSLRAALLARDGTERPIESSAATLRDVHGAALGSVLVFRDITERMRADETQARLAAIVESSQDVIVSKTLEGIIQSWNGEAERLFGYTAEEAIGQPITLIIPPERQDEERVIIERLRRGERVEHFDTVRITKHGRRVHLSLTISPVRDSTGRIIGASKVARDISDRKRTEEALREADRQKDEFLALLAHELRNPLAPLRNGLQILRLAGTDPAALEKTRAMMERQLGHLIRLVDDLLDVSRISRNKMELRRERVLLEDIVNSAVETARPAIDAAGHQLIVSLPHEPVHLDADLTRMAQVLSNLLTNSAKYTEQGGRIWLSAERRDGELAVAVRDNGIGIPADALPHIFDMFSQVDRSIERSSGGLGIGLALVKGLVEMHGGVVSAESGGPGKGSTFTVRLPLDDRPEQLAPETPEGATAAGLPKRRVLVVDDNRDSANSLAMVLELLGNEVCTVHDGVEAVEAAERFRPAVVLMDVAMPRLNGYDATRRIRRQPWGRDIVIIALTGWGQEDDRLRSRDAGCNGHLVKPVHLPDLEKLLADLQAGGASLEASRKPAVSDRAV